MSKFLLLLPEPKKNWKKINTQQDDAGNGKATTMVFDYFTSSKI
jgi:hypothetical protein